MEQTNGLIKFDDLKSLPGILESNQDLLKRAKLATQPLIDTFSGFDMATADADKAEKLDLHLADVQSKLSAAISRCEDRRKPGTRMLDEIKKHFTAIEGELKSMQDQVAGFRNQWQAEKARRIQAEQNKRDAELRQRQEQIEREAKEKEQLFREQTALINSTVERMIAAFNAKSADELDAYCDALKKLDWAQLADSKGIHPAYFVIFIDAMQSNRIELLDLKDSRKAELKRDAKAAAERVEREAKEREAENLRRQAEQAEQLRAQADAEKINASFDTMAKPIETPEISKGTVTKKKYKVTSHGGHVAIMRWWMVNIMPGMSLDDLQKKLSFMRTSADKALNQGDEIEAPGIEVVIDYSTRSTKPE